MRRAGILAAIAGLLCAVPAEAHWQAGGAGSGQAAVDTMPGGSPPSASASLDTVTVQWTQSTFGGSPLGGYAAQQRAPASPTTASTSSDTPRCRSPRPTARLPGTSTATI